VKIPATDGILTAMEIRPVRAEDLPGLEEIDGAIDSSHYLHVERTGEGLALQWRLEERPLRQKLMVRNPPTDEQLYLRKNVVTGIEEGLALLAEHEGIMVGLVVAHQQPQYRTMSVVDLRVDIDHRRQGLAMAMLYQTIAAARALELRAVHMETRADNYPANKLLVKLAFELAGLDTQRQSNHDLVKEAATLFWYAALD
jgi:ribosomal protein S18 acetylase RimI-like enzyme